MRDGGIVLAGDEARACLARSIALAARAIAPSLGPSGRGVLFHRPPAAPTLLQDGYQIARELADEAGVASIGPRIVKETLFDIDRDLGDGTATAAILLAAIVDGGFRLIRAGFDPESLADGLLALAGRLSDAASGCTVSLTAREAALAAARTAAGDDALAEAMADIFLQLGPDGTIEIDEGHRTGLETDVRPGVTVDASLVSRELSDESERLFVRLERPFLLVADEEIADFGPLLPVLEQFASRGKALLIVARDVAGGALQALVRNKREAGLRVAALKISDVVERGYEALEDLAIATGAELVTDRLGTSVARLRPAMLGQAEEATIHADHAALRGPGGHDNAIERRRAELRLRIAREKHLSYDREQLQRRLARLSGGVARVRIGGLTTPERQARLIAARKALAALRASRGGVVAGGGVMPLRLAALAAAEAKDESAASAAARLLAQSLRRVTLTLIGNSCSDAASWVARLDAARSAGRGIDLRTMAIVDLAAAGIVDPLAIVDGTIRRAISAAATLLRVEALVPQRR
jgi:chaperonin GroEL